MTNTSKYSMTISLGTRTPFMLVRKAAGEDLTGYVIATFRSEEMCRDAVRMMNAALQSQIYKEQTNEANKSS